MKKNLLLILLLFILLFNFNLNVHADMGPPPTASYEVIVTNLEGAKLYDYSGNLLKTIPYDTKLKITYEQTKDSNLILFISSDYGNGYIYPNDVTIIKENYDEENLKKLESKEEVLILNEDGAYLYAGPSKVYKKVSEKIPVNTTLTYEYVDKNGTPWIYTEYNGVKGWLYIYEFELGPYGESYVVNTKPSEIKLLSVNDESKLYKTIYLKDDEVLTTIDKNTKITCKYIYQEHRSNICYTNYNNTWGWVIGDNYNFAISPAIHLSKLITTKELNIYDDIKKTNQYEIKIPNNTKLEIIYSYSRGVDDPGFSYIKYNNIYGFIENNDIAYEQYHDKKRNYIGDESLKVYKEFDLENISFTLEKNNEFEILFSKYNYEEKTSSYYIKHNESYGWVKENTNFKVITENEKTETNNNNSNESDKQDNENIKWYKKLTATQFTIVCIGTAIVVALTSLITILLVNKKKKKKQELKNIQKEEPKLEKKEENETTEITKQEENKDIEKKETVE